MRSDTEINAEIKALKKALKLTHWNRETREQLKETVNVLEKRMTEVQVEREYYVDESSEDYNDGDNLLYGELVQVVYWLRGEKGYDAPSFGL